MLSSPASGRSKLPPHLHRQVFPAHSTSQGTPTHYVPPNTIWILVVALQSPSCGRPHGLQHARPPCPPPSPRACPSSHPLHPDAVQPSHPLMPLSPSAIDLSQHQEIFQWVICLHQVTKILGASASASVLSMNIQGWSPLRLTGLISLQSKGLPGVFSSITVRRHQFFGILPFLQFSSHNCTWPMGKTMALTIRTFVGRVMSLLFNTLSRFLTAFLPRSHRFLISWLHSRSAVILEPKKRKSAATSNFPPSICHAVMGPGAMILAFFFFFFLIFSLKPALSLSSFTLIKRLFSSSSLSAIKSGNEFLLSSIFSCLLTCWFTVCFFQGDVNFIIICLVNNCIPVLRKCLSHINTMSLINIWVKWMNK